MGSNFNSFTDERRLQLKVDQRLQELSDLAKTGTSTKFKSQRGGNVGVLMKIKVKWPATQFYCVAWKKEIFNFFRYFGY